MIAPISSSHLGVHTIIAYFTHCGGEIEYYFGVEVKNQLPVWSGTMIDMTLPVKSIMT